MNHFIALLLVSLGLSIAQVKNQQSQVNVPFEKTATGGGGWSEGGKSTPKEATRLGVGRRYTGGGGWSEGGK